MLIGNEISEEQAVKRVYSHLLIRDHLSAMTEGKNALSKYPHSKPLQMAYFRALCQTGDEIEALQFWENIPLPEREERSILEALGWGVLNKANQSTQLEIRLNVLLASALTKDVKALPLILEEMRSTNAMLRAFAVRLASSFGDAPLQKELERLLKEEKVWFVRIEVMQAIGKLGISNLRKDLKEILVNPKTPIEEKAMTQIALINIYDTITKKELESLIKSDRAGLRQLACDVVAHLELKDSIADIYPLLNDPSSDVRISALNALVMLNEKDAYDAIREHLEDPTYDVAITAAWATFRFDPKLGEQKLKKWIQDPNAEHRRLAAAALAVCGPNAVPLSLKMMKESSDGYVKATLAMGLIGQRKHLPQAHEILYKLLKQEQNSLWMWDNHHNPIFRSLAPSQVRHMPGIPHLPKVVDQMVRLELLSLLCITNYPKAEAAVREFLQSHSWGVTGSAAAILLGEGNEKSIEISESLLKDPDEKIRIQAALILAMMGNDDAAIPVLQEAYPNLDRKMKLHVLAAIAQVGDPKSIPFLLSRLKEPYQVLRVAAASAIIQCLYH